MDHETQVGRFEDLKDLWNKTRYPRFTINGELACDLLAAGLVTSANDGTERESLVPVVASLAPRGPMNDVFDILSEISVFGEFVLVRGAKGREIRVLPKSVLRREGN